eukprot:CAMPEP_0181313370 /NCGR_PEP_ID=MMETSP1101-20121128/14211_1 /TAXON_ID=46948 /ORGANISM="Rhodomonas abbreviata, Strain Caron Lab Isolate" /LENGTH=411 /DNA_ID=CAMNT_0023420317 /DNA_START=95 /DNA_END=1330 /DNA_ORIENTATION=-
MPPLEVANSSLEENFAWEKVKERSSHSYASKDGKERSFHSFRSGSGSNSPLHSPLQQGRSSQERSSHSHKSKDGSNSYRALGDHEDDGRTLQTLKKSSSWGSISSVTSSLKLVERFSHFPLNVRGRAEAWETPRDQVSLMEKVGGGTGGDVYVCRWRGTKCAAKVLTNESKVSVEYEDMVNQISIMSHLRHPNLVMFMGAVTISQPMIVLSEFMDGGSIEDRYNQEYKAAWKALATPKESAAAMDGGLVTGGLLPAQLQHAGHPPGAQALHSRPDNDNQLKVSAFGLSKTLNVAENSEEDKVYMAPEILRGEDNYSEKVDIYSMAMIFYYMVTGQSPSSCTETPLTKMTSSERRPEVLKFKWKPVEDLVCEMWKEESTERPPASKIVVDLVELLQESGGQKVSCWQACSIM